MSLLCLSFLHLFPQLILFVSSLYRIACGHCICKPPRLRNTRVQPSDGQILEAANWTVFQTQAMQLWKSHPPPSRSPPPPELCSADAKNFTTQALSSHVTWKLDLGDLDILGRLPFVVASISPQWRNFKRNATTL